MVEFVPQRSTAKTGYGCLAEEYAPVLAEICNRWLEIEQEYFRQHPWELTEADQLRLDVATSFYSTVRSAGLCDE